MPALARLREPTMNSEDEALVRRVIAEELVHALGSEEDRVLLRAILRDEAERRVRMKELRGTLYRVAIGTGAIWIVALITYIGTLVLDDWIRRMSGE